jgi:hypothetical protein
MQEPTYIETDCTITHNGRTFEAGGAVLTSDFALGYIVRAKDSNKLILTDWHGKTLSESVRLVSSWRINSALSDRMYQFEVTLNGVVFTGRGMGVGMVWKGRPKKGTK